MIVPFILYVHKIVSKCWYFYRTVDWILFSYNRCLIMTEAKRFVTGVVLYE